MKKISFLIFFIGLFILTSCNYSKVENITTSKTDEIQTTTEVPKKTLTADEVVALFNAKYDLFSENCEFDTDVSIFLFGKDGDCSESSYSEKCKYIDGKANYSVSTPMSEWLSIYGMALTLYWIQGAKSTINWMCLLKGSSPEILFLCTGE